VSLLTMGTAFWWPVLGPKREARLSAPAGIVYLFTACSACTLLGIYVTFSPVELCSVFLHPNDRLGVMPLLREQWGLSAQKDQQIGGLLMWVPACLVYGAGILALVIRLMKGDEEHEREEGATLARKEAT
jgi:cytochrome c oxidase assembly factor CtaG